MRTPNNKLLEAQVVDFLQGTSPYGTQVSDLDLVWAILHTDGLDDHAVGGNPDLVAAILAEVINGDHWIHAPLEQLKRYDLKPKRRLSKQQTQVAAHHLLGLTPYPDDWDAPFPLPDGDATLATICAKALTATADLHHAAENVVVRRSVAAHATGMGKDRAYFGALRPRTREIAIDLIASLETVNAAPLLSRAHVRLEAWKANARALEQYRRQPPEPARARPQTEIRQGDLPKTTQSHPIEKKPPHLGESKNTPRVVELTPGQLERVFQLYEGVTALLEWGLLQRRVRPVMANARGGSVFSAQLEDLELAPLTGREFKGILEILATHHEAYRTLWSTRFMHAGVDHAIESLRDVMPWTNAIEAPRALFNQLADVYVHEVTNEDLWKWKGWVADEIVRGYDCFPLLAEFIRYFPVDYLWLKDKRLSVEVAARRDPVPALAALHTILLAYFPDVGKSTSELFARVDHRVSLVLSTAATTEHHFLRTDLLAAVDETLDQGWTIWEDEAPEWARPSLEKHEVRIRIKPGSWGFGQPEI